MREVHPLYGGTEEKAAEVNKAFYVLADPDKRAQFDFEN